SDGALYVSCSIITIAASADVRPIHERMPVIVSPDAVDEWLQTEIKDPLRLERLLNEHHEHDLLCNPVSTLVNNVKNDTPQCIVPLK
ncbi:MAG: SOS response-associated peptidase, partial [Deltaproteobacteria bacterium]|nr:SOS response-associated peptidase [Deltaproteobacteria bacterium]